MSENPPFPFRTGNKWINELLEMFWWKCHTEMKKNTNGQNVTRRGWVPMTIVDSHFFNKSKRNLKPILKPKKGFRSQQKFKKKIYIKISLSRTWQEKLLLKSWPCSSSFFILCSNHFSIQLSNIKKLKHHSLTFFNSSSKKKNA